MDSVLVFELCVVVALVLANGILAGSEIAVVAMRRTRIQELAAAGSASARALERLRRVPERFLSTTQIGITVIGISAGAFGGATFAEDVEPWLRRIGPLAPHARELSMVLVVVLITYLSVVLGELVPKSLALRGAERYALLMARPLELLSFLCNPLVHLLTASSNGVLRVFGAHTSFIESRLSPEELRTLVEEAREGGSVGPEVGDIAARAIELGELSVAEVMIHRRFVVALPVDAPPEVVRETFLENGHHRIPIYEGTIDRILGYASLRDLVVRLLGRQSFDLRASLRPCHVVPESASAAKLLERMRAQRIHLAVVVDEHGGTAGIVTLDDLLEEVVGEFTSEHGPPPLGMRRDPDGSAVVPGIAPVREVNRALDVDLEGEGATMGGLCIRLAAGRIPAVGEVLHAKDGTRLEVVEASARRVRAVRVIPARAAKAQGAGSAR